MYDVQGKKAAKSNWRDEKFTKPKCNLYMQERLTILKMLRDKQVTIINKNSEIYGACRHKTTLHRFCLSTDDPIFNGRKG